MICFESFLKLLYFDEKVCLCNTLLPQYLHKHDIFFTFIIHKSINVFKNIFLHNFQIVITESLIIFNFFYVSINIVMINILWFFSYRILINWFIYEQWTWIFKNYLISNKYILKFMSRLVDPKETFSKFL